MPPSLLDCIRRAVKSPPLHDESRACWTVRRSSEGLQRPPQKGAATGQTLRARPGGTKGELFPVGACGSSRLVRQQRVARTCFGGEQRVLRCASRRDECERKRTRRAAIGRWRRSLLLPSTLDWARTIVHACGCHQPQLSPARASPPVYLSFTPLVGVRSCAAQ